MSGRPTYFTQRQNKGFSLLELIIVVVILGIMAVSLGGLSKNTVFSYIDAKDRNRLSQSGKWVIERISREIREALPQSIRTGSSGSFHCLEFLSIENASTSINLPASGAVSSFNAVSYDLVGSSSNLVAIMPINNSSVYNLAGGSLANVSSVTASLSEANQAVVTLSSATNFARRSPQNRFYLLGSPISFCLDDSNGEMYRYQGYTLSASQPFPPTGGNQIGENFSARSTVFNYQSGTLSRSGLLQINLVSQNRSRSLSGNEESFEIFHEVHVRNVP